MTDRAAQDAPAPGPNVRSRWARFLPFLRWREGYRLATLRADAVSGLTVALVLIPQSMAYAQLADLPAFYGLYAAFLPPLIGALFGSSHQLATGPVAIVSLMTSTALAPLATAGGEGYIAYALVLALLVGLFQLALGLLRLGMIVNFLSHPVVSGFTNAAAIIIATSQLPKLFGVDVDRAEHHYETVYRTIEAAVQATHWPTLALGALALAIMIALRRVSRRIPNVLVAVLVTTLIAWATGFESNATVTRDRIGDEGVRATIREYNAHLGDVEATQGRRIEATARLREVEGRDGSDSIAAIELRAALGILDVEIKTAKRLASVVRARLRALRLVRVDAGGGRERYVREEDDPRSGADGARRWRLHVGPRKIDEQEITLLSGGKVVGSVPRGLPAFTTPTLEPSIALDLIPMAVIISLLGFMEAISIAKAMAAQTRQRLDPNQELIGQGLANIVGAFFRSYPVSGSFSRSAVNLQAGAATGLSSAVSAAVVLLTLLFFTPLLYHLPQSVLAAVIMMAVIGLLNVGGVAHAWRVQKTDGVILLVTFVATLAFAPHLDRGIILGVVLSLASFLYRNMRPRVAVLSKTPQGEYRDASRWSLDTCRHVAVIRFSSSLFFANVVYLQDIILDKLATMPELRHILIVGNGINELDSSGEVLVSQLVAFLDEAEVGISFSGLNEDVIEVMRRTHLYDKIGEEHFYYSVAHAVQSIHKGVCLESSTHLCPLIFSRLPVHPDRQKPTRTQGEEW